jgi:hypothetical protein
MANLKPFTPITAQQIAAKGVAALGDRPNTRQQYGAGGLSAIELKLWFDQLATLIAARVTELQKALHEGDGDYISVNADADIVTLSDLTEAIFDGKLASKLRVGPAFGIGGKPTLDAMINAIERKVTLNAENSEKSIASITMRLDTTTRTLKLTLLNKDGTTLDTLNIDLTTTTERIADGAVTMPKIAHKSLSTDAFADQSISTRTLQPNAVTEDKLSLELLLKLENLKNGAVNGVRYDAASNKIIITNAAGVTFEAELNIDGANIGADPIGTAQKKVAEHNADTSAHADIRKLINDLAARLSAIADSDDNTLDQLSEIVTFIKSNKNLIDNITTAKINYSDIVNDLITNDAKKPLSAAQGVAIKKLIDELDKNKVGANELAAELNRVLEEAKESGEFDGESISISEVEESAESGGISVITFSDGTKMQVRNGFTPYIGDNGNWFIGNVDTTIKARGTDGTSVTVSSVTESTASGGTNVVEFSDGKKLNVKNGKDGKSAYKYAQEGGYTGTETAFAAKLATPFVTPQMFGAKGDGVTDDTNAFKNAIASNDNVFVPKGNYLITDTLDISYKKSLYSDDGQRATIVYGGTNSIVLANRMSVFRNINITIKNAFSGIVFDINNRGNVTNANGGSSRIEHINVKFETKSPNATLIGITADSGTDANDIPTQAGICFQTFHDIHLESSSNGYGYGIKMELIQGRAFTEDNSAGFPWITHINYDDIYLGQPQTAIKAVVTNNSGGERFNRIGMGNILFNNVYTQFRDGDTEKFLDVEHFGGYFTKCIGWDYHHYTAAGNKVNIIGENVTACFTDCSMSFGAPFLQTCDFTAETEYTVADNPEYFINKYFSGTVLSEGYDSIDAKIKAKLNGEYIGNIAEEKINDVLYSGYANVMDDPLTQIKDGYRFSSSSKTWVSQKDMIAIIIPVVAGGNIIRYTPTKYELSKGYQSVFFFNDDELTDGIMIGEHNNLWVSDGVNGYLQIDNPSGYKYVSIPFAKLSIVDSYDTPITSIDDMVITINREITSESSKSYTEYLVESVIDPAIEKKFSTVTIPTKTSELENDSGFLTEHQDISGKADKSSAETWTFTLADGSTVTKKVVLT